MLILKLQILIFFLLILELIFWISHGNGCKIGTNVINFSHVLSSIHSSKAKLTLTLFYFPIRNLSKKTIIGI